MSAPDRTPHPLVALVVDDSPDTADSLAELLQIHGHAVKVALSGECALQVVAQDVPDVVFLDIRMPGMDGFRAAELIRRHCAGGKQPLLIAVTGCGSEEDHVRSTGAGFDLHLVKPVDPAVLVGMMERFRQVMAPTIPVEELELPPEEPPNTWHEDRSLRVTALTLRE
jgi:CheY-like chemotaxis protein